MAANDNLHTGHRDRVRSRVGKDGLRGLQAHEVIEFLLFSVFPRQDVNEAAHRLIERFGSVSGVLHASAKELTAIKGVGPKAADFLICAGRAMDACRETDIEDRPSMRRYESALEVLRSLLKRVTAPSARMFCLDMDSRMIYQREITPSLSWGETGVIREALKDMLSVRTRYVIFALYGAECVTSYDIRHARELAQLLHACGIMLLDVIMVGTEHNVSMRCEGLIPETESGAEVRALCEGYPKE